MIKVQQWEVDQLPAIERKVFDALQAAGTPCGPAKLAAMLHSQGTVCTSEKAMRCLQMLQDKGFARAAAGGTWVPANVKAQEPRMRVVKREEVIQPIDQRLVDAVATNALVAQLRAAQEKALEAAALFDRAIAEIEGLRKTQAEQPSSAELAELREKARKFDSLQSILR